jgi:hypothetical protein
MTALPIRQLIPKLKLPQRPEPFASHHGFPMPRVEGAGLYLDVMSCPSATKPTGLVLCEPKYLLIFNATTGERTEARLATSTELGGPVGHEKDLGVDRLAPGQSQEDYLRDLETLYTAWDVLVPRFAADQQSLAVEERSRAATFKRLFPVVTEGVLQPYYHHLGRAWFRWLDKVTA